MTQIIKNVSDYWKTVDDNWGNLRDILFRFLPMEGHEIIVGVGEVSVSEKTMAQHVEFLKEEHHGLLRCYFDAAWEHAPDRPEIHIIKGWGILCDLCSEQWVFNPDESE